MEACDSDDQPAPLSGAGASSAGQAISGKKRRKVGRRACDGCIIRKVRCGSETPPCVRCVKVGIACSFNKRPGKRGPHHLRDKTIREINVIQSHPQSRSQETEQPQTNNAAESNNGQATNKESLASVARSSGIQRMISIQALVLRLCIFRVRLFPVWPIVPVDQLIAALHRNNPTDLESYALANAIAAATIAQLGLTPDDPAASGAHDTATASAMEAECQKVKAHLQRSASGSSMNLVTLRTAFFLHIYHENQAPGGPRSLLYLREAITVAQIMALHRESSYGLLPVGEQHARRRAIWLLFVTERGVAMLHNLPPILNWNASFPSLDTRISGDEAYVFPAFRQLVNLFWTFDQSGIFDLIGDSEGQLAGGLDYSSTSPSLIIEQGLRLLHQQLQTPLMEPEPSNDVQKADVFVTRLWMQALTWKMLRKFTGWRSFEAPSSTTTAIYHPVHIAKDLLAFMSSIPKAAVEAHGPAIEYKIFEVASSVIDSITADASGSTGLDPLNRDLSDGLQGMHSRCGHVLLGLQGLLASCRSGGNQKLLNMIQSKMAGIGNLSCCRPDCDAMIHGSASVDRRMLATSEREDRRMDGMDVPTGAECYPLMKLTEFAAPNSWCASDIFMPWILTTQAETGYYEALCSATDLASAAVPARRKSREIGTGMQPGAFLEQLDSTMLRDGNPWSLPFDGSVLLGAVE